MKTLKDFTPEIRAKIPEYIKKYTEGIEDGGRYRSFKKEDAEKLIYWNYEKCGFKKPVILIAENIYEQQLIFNYLVAQKDIFLPIVYLNYCLLNNIEFKISETGNSGLDSQLDSQLRSQLNGQLYSQLRSQLDSQLYSQLNGQLYSLLRSQLDSQLYSLLRSQLDSQLNGQLRSQLDSQLNGQLYSQLRSQLRSQLDSQLNGQLDSQLYSQLDSQLYSQLESQLRSRLDSQLDSQLRSQLVEKLKTYNNSYLFTSNVWSNAYAAWFKFTKDEFKLKSEIGVVLDEWDELYRRSGVYSAIFSELVCVVCKYPIEIKRDGNGNLHNVNDNAVKWGSSSEETAFDCYYVHGVNISKEMFDKLSGKEYTFEDWAKEKNEEVKYAALSFMEEKFGSEYLFRFLSKSLKEVDTYIDKKEDKYLEGTTRGMNIGVYTLFKGKAGNVDVSFVRCYCPSSDRMFFLCVDGSIKNAKDGIASLYRVPKKLISEIKYIQRQGERFSTVFTEKGKKMIDKMGKEEINDLAHISGEKYFSLLKYEY